MTATLPLIDAADLHRQDVLPGQFSDISSAPPALRLAVVDDYAIMRGVFETLVEDDPGLVMAWTASTLKQAADLLRRDPPELLIMDVGLPDGNGFDFVEQVLQDLPDLPVLMVSAHDDRSYPQRAKACGARGYLSKVASIEQVLHVLNVIQHGGTWLAT